MKYYSIGEFANKIGKTVQTLRNWDKNGSLKPHHITEGGTRYYSQEQLNHFLGLKSKTKLNKKTIGYCRVSSHKQKDDLERQIENVKTYMYAKGYQFEIISDIGSGINYNKKGLNQLIDMITNLEVDKIVVLHKDRLIRFGYELIENICEKYGTTIEIIDRLKAKIRKEKINDVEMVKPALKEVIAEMMLEGDSEEEEEDNEKKVMLIIGVNGVGKTTSIGKIAARNKNNGKKVLLAAADTFRAAAIDQLDIWSQRANVDIVKHQEGSDPAAVVFDAVQAAKARDVDLLICDTAGRLHNKKNLMDELAKINRIIDRELGDRKKETLLVLDGTTGQNAVIQAKQFMEACPIDGIILTKLDGTAKGGVVISIKNTLNIPVKYIGVGEGVEDLQKFNAKEFAEALL